MRQGSESFNLAGRHVLVTGYSQRTEIALVRGLTEAVATLVPNGRNNESAGVNGAKIGKNLKDGRTDSALLQEHMPCFAARDDRRAGWVNDRVKDLDGGRARHTTIYQACPLTTVDVEVHRLLMSFGLDGEDKAVLMPFPGGLINDNQCIGCR